MYNLNYRAIGQRIREYRLKSGLTQEELSERIGISPVHMSHIESGVAKYSLIVFVRLSIAIGASLDYLIFGDSPS